MLLIPIHCDACRLSSLKAANLIVAGAVTCAACGKNARTVPGASYAPEDEPLFDELSTALREASVTPANAARLLVDLRQHGVSLPRLAKTMASLAVVQAHVGAQVPRRRKAEGMLLTLLEAMASSRITTPDVAVR
ncbi:MAG TPA: hypothetical protein VEX18_09260 [Polyangiaceae bacterium]|nr:hypothetical protein [Polyangiaceae bacterium]